MSNRKIINEYANSPNLPSSPARQHNARIYSHSLLTKRKTPSQCILQHLFTQFVKTAEAKINEALSHSLDREIDMSINVREGADVAFDRLLYSLGSVSKHCPRSMIDAIMTWRKARSDSSDISKFAELQSGYPYPDMKIKEIMKERRSLISNFILCRVLNEITKQLQPDQLPDELGEKLEDMVFSQFKNLEPESIARSINRQINADFFAELIGVISNIRFASVSDKFRNELSRAVGVMKESKIELLIRSMRFLKLKLYPMEALEDTAEFLQVCSNFFQSAHSIKIKHAYAEVFVELLDPIAAVADAEVNLPMWTKSIDLIYPKATKMINKPRHYHVAYPLITTLLCVSRKDFFLNNWVSQMESCFHKFKDKSLKQVALSCVTRLLWVYLYRCSDSSTSNCQKRLDSILKVLFPLNRKIITPTETSLDLFVQIVYFITAKHLEYGLNNVILMLLNCETGITSFSSSVNVSEKYINAPNSVAGSIGSSLSQVYGGVSLNNISDDKFSTTGSNSSLQLTSTQSSVIPSETDIAPERIIIGIRAFLLILSDLEEVVLQNNSSSNPSCLSVPKSMSNSLSASMNLQVVVEGKINIPSPPFPSTALINKSSREERTAFVGGYETLRRNQKVNSNSSNSSEVKSEYSINNVISSKVISRFGISVRDSIDRVNEVIGRLALALEQSCGSYLITDERFYAFNIPILSSSNNILLQRRPGSSTSGDGRNSNDGLNSNIEPQSQIPQGGTTSMSNTLSHFSVSKERHMLFYLTKTYLNALPRCTPTGVGSSWMIETIIKYIFHIDEGIRIAASEALKRIAKIDDEGAKRWWLDGIRKHGSLVKKIMAMFENSWSVINERFPEILVNSVNENNEGYGGYSLGSLSKLFIELLEIWLEDVKKLKNEYTNEELIMIIGKIEGRGLLLISNCLPTIRKYGIKILKIGYQFEEIRKERFVPNYSIPVSSSTSISSTPTTVFSIASATTLVNDDTKKGNNNKSNTNNVNYTNDNPCSIITLMENIGPELVKKHYHDPVLATSTRSEYQKSQQRQRQQNVLREIESKDSLLHIAESDEATNISIWSRCYPDFIKSCFSSCSLLSISNCLVNAGARLLQLILYITTSFDQYQGKSSNNTVKWSQNNNWSNIRPMILTSVTTEMIDQWKYYLIFIASTIEIWNPAYTKSPHVMKIKQQAEEGNSKKSKITSAEQLFQLIAPLLSCEKISIRQSVVLAFGCINPLSYKTLLEILQPYIKSVLDDVKGKYPSDSKTYVSVRRGSGNTYQGKRLERLRMELAHIFSLIADFITCESCRNDDVIMNSIITYIKEIIRFLSDTYIQYEWDHQMLRYYFCGFIERLYDNLVITITNFNTQLAEAKNDNEKNALLIQINKLKNYINFDTRYQLFKLFENWCGYGQLSTATRDREARMMMNVLSQIKDGREKGALTTTMEEQRKALEMAALKSMSCLCKGEIIDPLTNEGFDMNSIFCWIDSIFSSADEKFHCISRASLKSLLIHNPRQPQLIESVIRKCYSGIAHSNISQGYFLAIVQIFYSIKDYPCKLHHILTLALYKIGDPDVSIRRNAIQLLKILENRYLHVNWVEEFESAIGLSSIPIIYKNAQAVISSRLAKLMPSLTYEMLSEITYCIELVVSYEMTNYSYSEIRNMFGFMLPWIKNVNIYKENDKIDSTKYQLLQVQQNSNSIKLIQTNADLILTNLFYLTIKFGNDYYIEMENLWTNLIEIDSEINNDFQNPQTFNEILNKNISIIIEFLLSIGVQKRNPAFVLYSKKIIVYISRTYACKSLIDTLIANITPTTLIPEMGNSTSSTNNINNTVNQANINNINNPENTNINKKDIISLFAADLDNVLIEMPKRPAFSKGQLAAVLFVDAAIEIGSCLLPNLPLLLHVIIVQLDHFITLICEQSRLLLLNLIQGILPKSVRTEKVNSVISTLIEKEGKRMWSYEDVAGKNRDIQSAKELAEFVEDLIEIFNVVDPNLRQTWGTLALEWGTSCPVRHVACRSFQVFRTLMPMLNQKVMGNLFIRLSYTLGDVKEEIQGFAFEILITLDTMVSAMNNEELLSFPQFFWACVAILYGPHEWEYLEGVKMLEKILNIISLNDPEVSNILLVNLPTRWKGQFTGLQPLLMRGLNSSLTEQYSLRLINKIILLEQDNFVDISNGRLLFSILANLPKMLQSLEYATRGNNPNNFGHSKQDIQQENDPKKQSEINECVKIAANLAVAAERSNYITISKLMDSYSKHRFRDYQDFLQKFINSIREVWFPSYELQTLQFLMGLLSNRITVYRRMVLKVLKILLPYIDGHSQYSALENIEEELVSPLLGLLRTDLSSEALEVLDEAMRLSDSRRDIICIAEKQSIHKISGAQSHANETDDSTGWSVSDPTVASEYIKYNMAGVSSIGHSNQDIYSMFGKKTNQQAYETNTNSNIVSQLISQSEASPKVEEVDVINILDDLDDFFDELCETDNSIFQIEDIETIHVENEKGISYELSNNNISSYIYSPIIKLILSAPQNVQVIFKLYRSYDETNQATAITSLIVSEIESILEITTDQFYLSNYNSNIEKVDKTLKYNFLAIVNFPTTEKYSLTENLICSVNLVKILTNIDNISQYQGILTSIVDKSYKPKINIDVQGFQIPYNEGDFNQNELAILSNKSQLYQETNSVTQLNEEIKSILNIFKSFSMVFHLIIDLYEELIQILKNLIEISSNDDISILEKMLQSLVFVRDSSIHPLYWPPFTEPSTSSSQLIKISNSFYQLQNEDQTVSNLFLHHRLKYISVINEHLNKYINKRNNILKLYQEKNMVSIKENVKQIIQQMMELFKYVLEYEGLLEQFLQITEDNRIHQLALIINCYESINNINNKN